MATKINSGFQALSFYRINCDAEMYVNPEKEIEEWIIENCEGNYYMAKNHVTIRRVLSAPKTYVVVFLEEETDVMALKLGWT